MRSTARDLYRKLKDGSSSNPPPQQQQQQQQQHYPPPSQHLPPQQWQPQYAPYQQQPMSGPQQQPTQYPQNHQQQPPQHLQHPQHTSNHQPHASAELPAVQAQLSQPVSGWNEQLFYTNGTPTPIFEAMMREFFTRLDPQRTGYITPEAFSSFLDVCEYEPPHNIWKKQRNPSSLYAAEDMADAELLWALQGFRFDHKSVVRNPARRQMPYGAMPLLSLAGFTDYMAVEFAGNPDSHLSDINTALRHYGVWPQMGPVPRHVLPASCPPEVKRRIEESSVRCQQASAEKINAQLTKARIQGMAGRATVALTSNNTYRYY